MPLPHVIVTGGAGFIGSHLVARLLAEGRRVTVIDNLSTGSRENLVAAGDPARLTLLPVAVSAVSNLDALLAGAEAVFHLAATVGVERVLHQTSAAIRNNFSESETILSAAARQRVPILVTSSSEVYGPSDRDLLVETDPLIVGIPDISRWSYGCSKLMVEFLALALARESQLPVVITRIFNTVGPRQSSQHGMVLPRFLDAARTARPLRVFGDGRQSRCFCWVEDTVEALVRLLRAPAAYGAVVNVGNDQPIAIGELAELVRTTLGSSAPIERVPYAEAYGPGFADLSHRRPDLRRLQQLVGFKPATTIETMVRRLAGR